MCIIYIKMLIISQITTARRLTYFLGFGVVMQVVEEVYTEVIYSHIGRLGQVSAPAILVELENNYIIYKLTTYHFTSMYNVIITHLIIIRFSIKYDPNFL